LPHAGALVAADAVAMTTWDPVRSVKHVSSTVKGRKSPSVVSVSPNGTRIYVSGQAERNRLLPEATRKTLESLRATLRFLGRGDKDIVQLKAFLSPMADASVVRREFAAFFGKRPVPPLVLVEWKSSPTVPIEIELVAWGGKNHAGEAVEYLTPPGMKASPVYSRVARINHSRSIYVSGLFASGPTDQNADANTPQAGQREVKEIFLTLDSILKKAGSDFRHLVKATYYVSTDSASSKLNELRPNYYDPQRPPAASKAVVASVGRPGLGLTMDMIAVPTLNHERSELGPAEYGHGLSADDALAGWISLFDGRTTFGWKGALVENGLLSGGLSTTEFGNCELRATFARGGSLSIGNVKVQVHDGDFKMKTTSHDKSQVGSIRLGENVQLKRLALRPIGMKSLFNGYDLTGWKRVDRPRLPEEKRPLWQVEDGTLHAVGGPGCLEYQKNRFGDMLLQLDLRTRVRHANSGVFFRAIPGDLMNGYEAQIFNRCEDGDPDRPARWCTGGIDDRQNARRLVSRDGRFFRMTIIAHGPHLATWVNGFQQTDWTDHRPPHANPRQGRRTDPGVIQLQAHDSGTDVEFKNITITEW
jgi:enamine deaminase RidA (YjgF/YER057c/UK114 family)